MLDLKRCNYITGQSNVVSFGISKIIDFFENSGRTPIFFYKKESNFESLIQTSKIEFTNLRNFEEIINDKSNLFRVDLLVIDLWFLKNISQVLSYKSLLDKLNIDYVILTTKYHYIEGDESVSVYRLDSEFTDTKSKFDVKYWVSDLVSKNKTSMNDLVLAFKRNRKIDDLFGNQ